MASSSATKTSSTYSPVTLSSFPANPLTTTFTAPPTCSGIYSSYIAILDQDKQCYPTGFNAKSTSYFSPGVACPSGYVTACYDTAGVKSITTVTCCPTVGDITMSCVNPSTLRDIWSTLFCTWTAGTKGTILAVTESSGGTTSTVASTMSGGEGINAYGIRMVHQQSDLVSSSTATTTTTSTDTPASTSQPAITSGTSTSTSTSTGLSTGAIIGLAVAIPLALLIAATVLFFVWRRRKARYDAVNNHTAPGSPGGGNMGYTGAGAGGGSGYGHDNKEGYNNGMASSSYAGSPPPPQGGGGGGGGGYYKSPGSAAEDRAEMGSSTPYNGGHVPGQQSLGMSELTGSGRAVELPAEHR